MTCKICGHNAEVLFKVKVLNKYDALYFRCANCEYIFSEEPFWLKEAYQRAINISDTGILDRNIYFRKLVTILIYFFYDKHAEFLDYAGGYGIFTRLMRDTGFNFYWSDPYCENILANGFEYNSAKQKQIELLTAFEVFEHLNKPIEQIEEMLKISRNIAFSTELIPDNIPQPGDWWYFAFEHGQHISFYSQKTLQILADKFNLNFFNYEHLHLFTDKKLNRTLFYIIIKLNKFGLFGMLRKILKSRTMEDHFELKKRQNE